MALTKIKCITAGDQSMVESGVPEGGEKTARWKQFFFFFFFFFVNEHNNANTKAQAKKQRFLKLSQKFPEEKQQLVEKKR